MEEGGINASAPGTRLQPDPYPGKTPSGPEFPPHAAMVAPLASTQRVGTMNEPEKRSVVLASAVLLAASLVRGGWELRTPPPILPPDTTVYEELVAETRAEVEDEERRRTPLEEGERIDVNRDDEVELARLPGVGPALAGRIVRFREEEGGFSSADELLGVPGIGPATLEEMREHVEVGGPPQGTPSAAGPLGGDGVGRDAGDPAAIRVNVNRADVDELQELPGVGPALAERIVRARRERGTFGSVEELLEVSGIGPATLEGMRDRIELGG